jgi:hypothetical protein
LEVWAGFGLRFLDDRLRLYVTRALRLRGKCGLLQEKQKLCIPLGCQECLTGLMVNSTISNGSCRHEFDQHNSLQLKNGGDRFQPPPCYAQDSSYLACEMYWQAPVRPFFHVTKRSALMPM